MPDAFPAWVIPVVFGLMGACIGSFLNVVIYRMPQGVSVNDPARSFCPECGKPIPWFLNIPVLSWLALRGKSACCGTRISFRYCFVELFSALLFLTLPGSGSGSFIAFYLVFMGLFLTAGLGSGSTFQMIAVIFRQLTIYRVKLRGGSDEQAQREAVTDTAAALGFISAIGAVGGFFIPKAFGSSLAMTGSPVGAMKIFLVFYIVCVLVTWLVYGRRKPKQK